MKQRDLERHIRNHGCFFHRHGGLHDIWLNPAFRRWNIEDYVRRITCPVLAIQGAGDEYGTMDQIERIARLAPDVTLLKLDDCGHSPHRDQPDAVIDATARFIERLRTAKVV